MIFRNSFETFYSRFTNYSRCANTKQRDKDAKISTNSYETNAARVFTRLTKNYIKYGLESV